MEQINTSYILSYFKHKPLSNKLVIFKNIFYIKLLAYFEDMDFLQYLQYLDCDSLQWNFFLLITLFVSKCSDQFVNKFINEQYSTFPLKQRLGMIGRLNFVALGANTQNVIKSIKKLSFYEQKEFIKNYLNNDKSPTQLIVCRLVTPEEMIKYMFDSNSLFCAINLYVSKYIDIATFLQIANKAFESNEWDIDNYPKIWLQLGNVCSDTNYLLKLIVFNLSNCYSLYPFKKLMEKMPSNALELIISNKKLCGYFFKSLISYYDLDRTKSIIDIFGKKINPTPEQKNILIDCFVKYFYRFSGDDLFVYLIKIFNLTQQEIKIVLQNSSSICTGGLGKKLFIYLKESVIDLNEPYYSDTKIELFKKFVKLKLLNENEIKYFILDNVCDLKYYQISKYIKNFKQEYFETLCNTTTHTINSLWILHFKFNVTSLDLVEKIFLTIKPDDQDWLCYDLIESLIKKFNLEVIQNIFLELLDRFSVKKFSLGWIFNDILRHCLIDNKIEKMTQEKKDIISKFVGVYKNYKLKKMYLN